MTPITTPNNRAIEQTIVAVARAQSMLPGFDRPRAVALATSIDSLVKPEPTMLGIFALSVVLLRMIGYSVRDALNAASAASAAAPLGRPRK